MMKALPQDIDNRALCFSRDLGQVVDRLEKAAVVDNRPAWPRLRRAQARIDQISGGALDAGVVTAHLRAGAFQPNATQSRLPFDARFQARPRVRECRSDDACRKSGAGID